MADAPYSLLAELEKVKDKGRPPIHLWNPDNVKDIDIVIRRDGTWEHEGAPIKRARLMHLFASVMRLEDDGEYYLVTPVEKCRISVEDAPFSAISVEASGEGKDQTLTFTTNVAETVTADADHPIRVEVDDESGEPSPYVMVRDGLEALINRATWYELAGLLAEETLSGEQWDGLWSGGEFFPFIRANELS